MLQLTTATLAKAGLLLSLGWLSNRYLSVGWFSCSMGMVAFIPVLAYLQKQPRDALMELAAGVHGDAPEDLVARSKRLASLKAKARPPPSQEEELSLLDTTPCRRFNIEDPSWLEHLDAEGFVVIADVASSDELRHSEGLLWSFLEEHTTWRRSDADTWSDVSFERIGSVQNGIVNGAGMGQSDFLWHLRTLPTVRKAFELIWGTSELLVSFDAANVFRPWHHGFRKTVCGWWHVDQGKAKQGRHAVQGFVSLYAANSQTGGLTVVQKSHLRFDEVVGDQQNPHTDYCTVQPYSPVLQEGQRRLICCEAGDLVLWDSRTVHANAPAPAPPTAPRNRLLRAVGYICMTPASFAPDQVRQARRVAYENDFSTSHWPQKLDLGQNGSKQRKLSDAPAEVAALVG
eukprot:TRINITY_DN28665_c0_g1_i1.p1 TRINITY_DN28665_c0_g1~~TRINITY_DN28665_c0_g1_i1.p1  ORF type:complete len:419 (-),score=55.62 TRINITY_DN28665_c0_g1_i1:289-1491(-)